MIIHRPFEYYFARGLICLIFGIALRAPASEWSSVPPPSQTPSAATVLGPTPGNSPAQSTTQAPPSESSSDYQPPQQTAPDNNNNNPPAQPAYQTVQPTPPATQTPQPGAANPGHQNQPAPSQNGFVDHAWMLQKISPDYDWTRHFRLGMLAGFNIKANMSMSGTFGITPTQGEYDDGYVLPDSAGSGRDSAVGTGNFGFDSTSQVSPDGSTLTMHQATGFSANNASANGNDSPYIGLDLAYGDSYWYWEHAKIGWEFGFGFLPIDIRETVPVSVNQNVFEFNNGGINLTLLPAGYQGGYNARGDHGNLVQLPTGPLSPTSTDNIAGTTQEKLNVILYTFRLGPTLYWNLCKPVGLYVGGGPAVGFVSGDLSSSGGLNLADGTSATYNASHVSGTDLVYGGYLNATLVYHAVDNGDFYLGAEYMPLKGANFSGSGMSAHLDLSGQVYITAGINWPF